MPSQFARPIADAPGYEPGDFVPLPLWPELDEVVPSDTDFVRTTLSVSLTVTLSGLTGPLSGSTATLRMRYRHAGTGSKTQVLLRLASTGSSLFLATSDNLLSSIVTGSFTTLTFPVSVSSISGFLGSLDATGQMDGDAGNIDDFSWVELEAPPVSVVTAPLPPILHNPHQGQTYGGTVVPILWSYSTFSGPGSQTTPSIDISFSTDCGTSWSTLSSGIEWTSTITLTGYAWDSTDSAMTVTNCARVRIRESNDTPSSWVTSGSLFPPRIWIPPPISTATESWSRETISVVTWTVPECETAQTWVAPSIDSATWGASACSSAMTWFSLGV